MWILPKNYQLSSRFAQDMVESKEDLTLQGLNIELSLMSRSKPIALQTWLRRWKPGNYHQRLFTRILKPSQRTSFETKLTLSLAVIPASRFQQQVKEKDLMTQDTCGLTLGDTLKQLDLLDASLKMSKDTFRLDSPASLAIWKKMVTEQRGEYSQRVKLAHHTNESESISWPTVTVNGNYNRKGLSATSGDGLATAVKKWPTPTVQDGNKATKKMRENHQNNLTAVVFSQEAFPTPTTRDWKGGYNDASLTRSDGKSRRFDALPNAVIGGVGTDIVPGHLNPDWVEWLMGVPTGWTDLGSWETE